MSEKTQLPKTKKLTLVVESEFDLPISVLSYSRDMFISKLISSFTIISFAPSTTFHFSLFMLNSAFAIPSSIV